MTEKTVKIEVFRQDSLQGKGSFVAYNVPYKPTMRVLDALRYIQQHIDGTLAFRWNCSMGICGSCAMEVNGSPVLTCKTELKPGMLGVKIAPLRAFPVIKDLVADYASVYDAEKKLKLWLVERERAHKDAKGFHIIYPDEIKDARVFRGCIECMICMDSCRPFREKNVEFLGPKSIVKAAAYDQHPHDSLDRKPLMEQQGLWDCNITRCCTGSCPEGIPITDKAIVRSMEGKSKQ